MAIRHHLSLMTVVLLTSNFLLTTAKDIATAKTSTSLVISPTSTQVKPIGSKMIFTCGINNHDNPLPKQVPEFRWIDPHGRVVTEPKGRVFVERLEDSRLRLYITRIEEGDEGQYTCETDANEITLSARNYLQLYEEIEFTKLETSVTYEAGSSALITCSATGKPKPQMSWRFHNRKITFDGAKYSLEEDGLRIHYIEPSDSGMYECRAEVVSQGNLKVQTILVDVLYAPVLTESIVTPLAVRGSDVTLKCKGHGNPPVTFQWFKEVEISDDVKDRHLLAEDKSLRGEGDLQLTNVDFTDNGRYVCQMSNELGSFEQPVDLRILVAPELENMEQTVSVLEGQTLTIPCQATGRPNPVIKWTAPHSQKLADSDDVQLQLDGSDDGRHHQSSSSVLEVAAITRDQAGTYMCYASNAAGNATIDVNVVVEYAATVTADDANRHKLGWAEHSTTFTCIARGLPVPGVVWLRGDSEYVSISSDEIYTITTTVDGDQATSLLEVQTPSRRATELYDAYTCLAKNSHGSSSDTFHLVEAYIPEMPANVTVKEVGASTVLLSADSPPVKPVSEHGGLDVVSWVVTYQAESDDGAPIGTEFRATFSNGDDMTLIGLKPGTSYAVSVSAVNQVGVGTAAKVRVMTSPATESETGMQSDDGRVGHQAAAASWSLAEQSMPRDGEAGGVWDQLSIVVVVGIAVVLATVVVAVSALILHTQRRLHSARAAQPDTRHAAGGAPAAQRRSDIEQATTVNVSDERDVDNLTLKIKGRRPSSPAGSVPDQLYRSLGRSAGRGVVAAAQSAEYGIASPRLGSRSAVASPALGARPAAPSAMPVAAVEASSAQRTAWNQMLEEAAERVAGDDEGATAGVTAEMLQENEDEGGCDDEYNDEAVDMNKEDCSISSSDEEFDQRLPTFEGKSFLYP